MEFPLIDILPFLVLSYLYLTQPQLYLPLVGDDLSSQEVLHTAVVLTDYQTDHQAVGHISHSNNNNNKYLF